MLESDKSQKRGLKTPEDEKKDIEEDIYDF